MGNFSAVYVKLDGPNETNLGQHPLSANTVKAAIREARARAPQEANSIKICQEGQVIRRILLGL
jgi:hypothetical protein